MCEREPGQTRRSCSPISKRFSTLRGHHQELGVVEPFWEAQLAVLAAVVLYVALPTRLTVGPRWLVPSLEVVLLFGLAISTPYRHHTQSPVRRRMSIGLIAIVTAANFAAEGLLVHYLLQGHGTGGRALVLSAAQIWFTNVAVFGLWFWEVDRGGPHMRTAREPRAPDFLFPQTGAPEPSLRSRSGARRPSPSRGAVRGRAPALGRCPGRGSEPPSPAWSSRHQPRASSCPSYGSLPSVGLL